MDAYPASGAGSVRPHAVASITGVVNGVTNPSFGYDANGNLVSGAGRTWSWTAANRPRDITQASQTTSFTYGPERQRIKQTVTQGASTVKTIHYAGAMQKETAGGVTTVRTYLPLDLGVIVETGGTSAVRLFSSRPARFGHRPHRRGGRGARAARLRCLGPAQECRR